MPNSRILDLAIGLVFVFAATAALSSIFTELTARVFALKADFLLRGLRELVGGNDGNLTGLEQSYNKWKLLAKGNRQVRLKEAKAGTPPGDAGSGLAGGAFGALLGGPILGSQGMQGNLRAASGCATDQIVSTTGGGKLGRILTGDRKARRQLPSYISGKSFTEAVIDLVIPDDAGLTTMRKLRRNIDDLPDSELKASLQAMAKSAAGDVEVFRKSVERWYDDHMLRVSGWYKRHVAKISLAIGTVLIVLLNINAITIARTLYTDNDARTAVATLAAAQTQCPADQPLQPCLETLQKALSDVSGAGLPVGWATVPACQGADAGCNWLDQRGLFNPAGDSWRRLVLVLLGFSITIIALVPGARFWYDLLAKLGSLRSTGPPPPTAAS